MRNPTRLTILVAFALAGLAGLAGCVVAPDGGRDHHYRYYDGYRYEHGDRIDRDGHRDEHWCDHHRDYEHCR